ncbi:OLC1v1021127C1 [Oldenlandia corymbosa var. corymbosa]|uniref:OLC1v1021127C1 n=1 Tax=Oldenlandia corymbosa var. corymbosa TaxID=529605 RepID=A0AAV1BXF4_OLDCO|nr:OLC1v1021127C1 [Oldenlandia corymbosa var. corymbosa]
MATPISKDSINKASVSTATARKLLALAGDEGDNEDGEDYGSSSPSPPIMEGGSPSPPINRIGDDDQGGGGGGGSGGCSKDDILVFQGQTPPLPSGIPTYTVHVENTCAVAEGGNSCNIRDIHLKCGWFSSARLTNPKVFRRLSFDDCLVKDGQALSPGETLYFQYANSFAYDMVVSSVTCT